MSARDLGVTDRLIYDWVRESRFPVELYPFQQDSVNELGPLPRTALYYDMGCVDSETEYLSETGWVKISKYLGGKVAQYNVNTGQAEFVQPTEYVKKPCDMMYRFKTTRGIDQVLSPEHRVLYMDPVSRRLKVLTAEQVAERHLATKQGFKGKFLTTFKAPDMPGLPLSDDHLRLTVAVIADGHFTSKTGTRVVVNLKREDKKSRLRLLLDACGISFTEHDRATAPGYTYFSFYAPMRRKEFTPEFYQLTGPQLKVVSDECLLWDGSVKGARSAFFTSVKASADFLQYAFAATGTQTTLAYSLREREGRKDSHEYILRVNSLGPYSSIAGVSNRDLNTVSQVPSTDGYKYCFMVPSSFLILRRGGRVVVTGNTGKTLTSLAMAHYKLSASVDTTLVIVPPVLLINWSRNIAKIPGSTHTVYAGPPAKRKKLDLNVKYIVVGIQIFKRDFDYLSSKLGHKRVFGIVDEAQMLKDPGSDNFKKVRDFFVTQQLCLLTGTPVSVPTDAYAQIKLKTPNVYKTQYQFESIHVEERDFFKRPTLYRELELLNRNLMLDAHRVLKEDVLKDLPEVTYTPIEYALDPEHLKLYNRLADDQMAKLSDGTKLDLTSTSALFQALQQIPCNAEHFSEGEIASTVLDLIDSVIEELDGKKLILFCHYKMTVKRLTAHLSGVGAVSLFGETVDRQAQLDRFVRDPKCQVIVMNIQAGGAGVDGLQEVCRDVLFVELPYRSTTFHQAVARAHRVGQKNGVNVRVAIAEKTLQHRIWRIVQELDTLVNTVIRGPQDLRDALAGR